MCGAAPELATAVHAIFDAYRHETLAALRKDGALRISAIAVDFVDGQLWPGMMAGSRKALDLRRDPRFALHSGTGDVDPVTWKGDAKNAGTVEEITDSARIAAINQHGGAEEGASYLFRAEIAEIVLTRVGVPPDHIVIESWHEGRGLRRVERR